MQYINEEGDTCYIHNTVRIFWPEFVNGKPCPVLQQALMGDLVDSAGITRIDQVVGCLLDCNTPDGNERKSLKTVTAFPDEMPHLSTSNVNVQLKELGQRLLTYHIYFDTYMAGAAHGIYANQYATYDLKNEKMVYLADIVADTTQLRTLIMRSIKEEYHYDIDDLLLPEGNQLPMPSDFYIDGQVLHAVYQVYDIASYAQGMIDAPIYPYMINAKGMSNLFTPYGKELLDLEDWTSD